MIFNVIFYFLYENLIFLKIMLYKSKKICFCYIFIIDNLSVCEVNGDLVYIEVYIWYRCMMLKIFFFRIKLE